MRCGRREADHPPKAACYGDYDNPKNAAISAAEKEKSVTRRIRCGLRASASGPGIGAVHLADSVTL